MRRRHRSVQDSTSSGLLSPIDFTASFFPRHSILSQHDSSFDSGYADGPEPMRMSPPRTPRRMSTLSVLSLPFGSPSARGIFGGPANGTFDAPPTSALFSPRFGAFPVHPPDEERRSEVRHSRDDSVDSILLALEQDEVHISAHSSPVEIQVEEPSALAYDHTANAVDEAGDSVLFSASDYLGPGDDSLRVSDASFGSDESMTSLYDQYYTPTIHTQLLNVSTSSAPARERIEVPGSPPALQITEESSPAIYDGLFEAFEENSANDALAPLTSPSGAGMSPATVRPPSVASSASDAPRVFSPVQPRPPSSATSAPVRNFSLPNSARNSIVLSAAPSRAVSPAPSIVDDGTAEGSVRSASSLSEPGSRKVPFGFRNVASSERATARLSMRRSPLLAPSPAPVEEEQPSRSTTPLTPVEEIALTSSPASSSNPRRLKPLRLVSAVPQGVLGNSPKYNFDVFAVYDTREFFVIAWFFGSFI